MQSANLNESYVRKGIIVESQETITKWCLKIGVLRMGDLGYIDFILLGFIVFSGFRGFFSGFICELLSFITLVLGMVFASRYAYEMGEWIKIKIYPFESITLSTLFGFITIFLLIWIFSFFVSRLILYLTMAIFPNYLNRFLGILFAALKAFIALGILLHFVFRIDSIKGALFNHFQANSVIYPSMENIASKIVGVDIIKHIPKSPEELQETLEEMKKKLDETKEGVIDDLKESSNLQERKGEQ